MAAPAAAVAVLMAFCLLSAGAQFPPYANYTVGGGAGWVFDSSTNKSAVDYAAWASGKTFYLGDYLIFNKNAQSTVIQTYNKTTYRLCSLEQDYGNLTTQCTIPDSPDGGSGRGDGAVEVPLTQEGDNYYFSDAYGGFQCRRGMRFHIVVQHGNGLPSDTGPPPPAKGSPPPLLPPIGATPSSQSGVGGRGKVGYLPLVFSVGALLLLLPPPPPQPLYPKPILCS